jgi:hypothetical protein
MMVIIKENKVTESSVDVVKSFNNLVAFTAEELKVYNRNFVDKLLATAYVATCIAGIPNSMLKTKFGVDNKLNELIKRYLPGINDFSPYR